MIDLLLIFPFWAGDKPRLHQLSRIISGLEPHPRQDVHVMLAPRQDCDIDQEFISTFQQRFHAFTRKCNSPSREYPDSTNGMFFSCYQYLRTFHPGKYDATLWMEADMCPIDRRWLNKLISAWKSRKPNIYAMGHIFPVGGNDGTHLNGGAMWSPRILEVLPDICSCSGAWDWSNRNKILPYAQGIEEIHYWHHARNVPSYPKDGKTVLIHGVKDDSLMKMVAADNGLKI